VQIDADADGRLCVTNKSVPILQIAEAPTEAKGMFFLCSYAAPLIFFFRYLFVCDDSL
jgi:hypothetical protein